MGAGDDDLPFLDPAALARAEAALDGLARTYLDWLAADQRTLEGALADLLLAKPGALGRLFAVAHDMKGQAGTFGYPLVTELANRLCRLVEGRDGLDRDTIDRVAALVTALAEVAADRLSGDGGERGRAILARL